MQRASSKVRVEAEISTRWPQRRHGPIQQLADNLWRVEGPVPNSLIRRQMVVARDSSRRLLIHSAIALDSRAQSQLESLGTPFWLVVPNGYHRLDAAAYEARYPWIQVVTPEGSRKRVESVVPVDLTYSDFAPLPELVLEQAPWPAAKEGVVWVRSSDGITLVFNDLLYNPPANGFSGFLYRLLKQRVQVPWLAKRMFVPDRDALRGWLARWAETPDLVRIIPGHGLPISAHAQAILRVVASEL